MHGTKQPATTRPAEFSWTASEYVAHDKNAVWYLLFGIVALSVTAFIYIVLNDLLAAITVGVVAASFGFLAARPPHTRNYALSAGTLHVGDKTYPLDEFKSYSIVEESMVVSIWLKPLARFAPFVVLYYEPKDEQKIVQQLGASLPNEPRELDFLDRMIQRLRF